MKKPNRSLLVTILALIIVSLIQFSMPSAAESAKRVVKGRTGAAGTARRTTKAKTPPTFAGGAGTSRSPYVIRTAAQLAAFARSVNNGNSYAGKYVKLGGDIDLSATSWTPIGFFGKNRTQAFRGVFDGAGYTIWNLRSAGVQRASMGLFGALEGATVSRVSLQYVDIEGDGNVGAIAAFMKNSAVRDCTVSGTVTGSSGVGGLIGTALAGGIQNGSFSGSVKAEETGAGGLIGTMDQTAIRGGYVTGRIEGNDDVGGIAGAILEGSLTNCRTEGLVVEGRQNIGGLIGNVIDHCDAGRSAFSGQVAGEVNAGGVVGYMMAGSLTNCSSAGSVQGRTNVGGIVGELADGEIRSCSSGAAVTGASNVGGVGGYLAGGKIERSSNSGAVTGGEAVGGLVGNLDHGNLSGSRTTGNVIGTYEAGSMVGMEGDSTVSDAGSTGKFIQR